MVRPVKIGIVDTTFSRVDMGAMALDELERNYPNAHIVRRTVPGIKDLPVACQKLLTEDGCEVALALGMVGGEPIDTLCGHESSQGIQQAMLRTNKHIIECFVHVGEAKNDRDLFELANDRVRKHAHNAVWIVADPQRLVERAGTGRRQGRSDAGPVGMKKKKTRK